MNEIMKIVLQETLLPLVLMIVTITSVVLLPYHVVVVVMERQEHTQESGIKSLVINAWQSVDWNDHQVVVIIAVPLLWSFVSLLLPGERYYGPATVNSFRPEYTKSGFMYYLISMSVMTTILCFNSVSHLYSEKFVTFGAMLTLVGLVLSIGLFVKGHLFPSPPGLFATNGNPVYDFYWGLELYPRMYKVFDFKTIIISRFGCWMWQAVVLWSWKVNHELNQHQEPGYNINYCMSATTILQSIYLAKFFYFEDRYIGTSVDITNEKFGYHFAWGSVAFMPTFYAITSVFLIQKSLHANQIFGFWSFVATVIFGIMMMFLTYETDRQKHIFRSTNGKCKIWGQTPRSIDAVYKTDDGKVKHSLLLVSGFWGFGRHVNYAFELCSTLSWSLPAIIVATNSAIPYLNVVLTSILLIQSSYRDDEKCRLKYNNFWDKYCHQVPYRIVSLVY